MQFLDAAAADFEQAFTRIVRNNRDNDADVGRDVATILNEVRARGDDALVEYTMRFDGHRLTDDGDWRISAEQCRAAYDALDPTLRDALQLAADRIRAYHEQQLPQDSDRTDSIGMRLGSRFAAYLSNTQQQSQCLMREHSCPPQLPSQPRQVLRAVPAPSARPFGGHARRLSHG